MASKRDDQDAEKRIKLQIEFMKKDAREKAKEINMKADEEFQLDKGRILDPEKVHIIQEHEKKMKQLVLEQKIEYSKRVNEARLLVLKEREKLMKKTQEKTFEKLAGLKGNKKTYELLMKNLIVQGLIRMDEKMVEIQVVKDDLEAARSVFEEAGRIYIKIMKDEANKVVTVDLKLDDNDFLPAGMVGGVMLKARKGKIVLDNTLQSRLKVAAGTLMPILRGKLFGVIPHKGIHYKDEDKTH